jgi:hypothetical protein
MSGQPAVTRKNLVTNVLTMVPVSVTGCESRPVRDVTSDGRLTGRVRFPRAGFVTLLPGGLGIGSAGMMTGLRGASLDWDSVGG